MIKETYSIAETKGMAGGVYQGLTEYQVLKQCKISPLSTGLRQQNTLTKKRTYVDTQAAYEKKKKSKGGFIGY